MGKIIGQNVIGSERVVSPVTGLVVKREDGKDMYKKTGEITDNISLKYDDDETLASLAKNQTIQGSKLGLIVNAINRANPTLPDIQVDTSSEYYVSYNGENKVDGLDNSVMFNKRAPQPSLEDFDTSVLL